MRCSERRRPVAVAIHTPLATVAELGSLDVAFQGQSLKFLKFVATPKSRLRAN